MLLDLAELTPSQVYFTLIQAIVPRPIAWVLTANAIPEQCAEPEDYNLAPFSYFTPVSSSPAVVVVSMGKKPDGSDKDTLRNLKQQRKATIHIASVEQAAAMTESSRTREWGDSEVAAQNLELMHEPGFSLPRLKDCRIAIDAEWFDCYEIGETPQSVVFLKLNKVWISEAVVKENNGRNVIEPNLLNPLARLGANTYAGLSESFTIQRPD